MKNFMKNVVLFLMVISVLTGCSYYNNQTRQANLEVDLAKYRSTMQMPATFITPAHYVICDDRLYPCSLITPIHLAAINDTDPVKLPSNQPKQVSKKYYSVKKVNHTHLNLKRFSSCKN